MFVRKLANLPQQVGGVFHRNFLVKTDLLSAGKRWLRLALLSDTGLGYDCDFIEKRQGSTKVN